MAKPKTNVKFVQELMTKSDWGMIAELFVIDAIAKLADQVADAKPADAGNALICGEAWVGVAKEIKRKLATR